MAIPYDTTNAGTSVRNALRHSSIRTGGSYKHIEDIQIKHSEHGEILRKYGENLVIMAIVHGEHFLFNATEIVVRMIESIKLYLRTGYGGNKIKGLVTLSKGITRRQMNQVIFHLIL